MKSKRILLAILMMAAFGWQSAFALEYRNGGLLYTTTTDPANPTANVVKVRLDETNPTALANPLVIAPQVEMYPGTFFTVIEIEDGAFAALGDPATNSVYSFSAVTIPATVKKIGDYAFVNTTIGTLTILRDSASTLEVGLDAFGGTSMIVKEVRWGGSIKQWCEIDFANMGANPITVKDWSADRANYPRLALLNPIQYVTSETAAPETPATSLTYTYFVDRPVKSTTTARMIGDSIVAYASPRLILPEDVETINPYAFANRPFRYIKALCATPNIAEGTFSFIENTRVYVTCTHKDGYNNHSEWKKAYNRRGNNYVFVEYNPGDIVRDADKYIYSTINPTEVIATIKYSKPVCTGADAGKWVITAEPKPGYRFNRWSGGDFNGVTDNPLKGEVDQTMPATAFVDRIIYSVSLGSNNETMGTIGYNSELSAYYNEYMTLTATANTGYKFVRWSNGHSENPYTIRITSDTTLTAYFEKDETIETSTVYTSDLAGEDSHLWRIENGQSDIAKWTLEGGKLVIKQDVNQPQTSTNAYAFRRVKLQAGTYYNLDLGTYSTKQGKLYWALINANTADATVYASSDDSVRVFSAAESNWKRIPNSTIYTAPDTTIHLTPAQVPASGYYILALRHVSTVNRHNTVTVGSVKFSERKFAVKAEKYPATADGTVAGSAEVYVAGNVTLTATTGIETATARNFGYKFIGWFTDTNSTTPISTAASYTVPATAINTDLTFYAKYEPKAVEITLAESKGQRYLPGNDYISSNQLLTKAEEANFIADNDYFDYDETAATSIFGYNTGIYFGSESTLTTGTKKLTGVHDQEITLMVDPVDGYEFKKWSDGNTDNPRVITLSFTGAAGYNSTNTLATMLKNLKPEFKKRADYTVSAVVFDDLNNREDNTMGTVTGTGTFEYNDQVTLIATPKQPHYVFVRWVDGNGNVYTDNTITFKVKGDNYNSSTGSGQNDASRQLRAYFKIKEYTVTIYPENPEQGNVEFVTSDGQTVIHPWIEGQGRQASVKYRSTARVIATAFSGYKFAGWQSNLGTTSNYNEYVFSPTTDVTLTAMFVVDDNTQPGGTTTINDTVYDTITLPAYVFDTTRVYVRDTVHQIVKDTVTVTVTVPVTVHEQVIVYDTTIVPVMNYKDSVVYVPVYVNNPVYRDTVVYITSYIPVYRDTTITRPVYIDQPYYDTISVTFDTTICDTLTLVDTLVVNNYIHDTIYITEYIHDTIYIHDTVGVDDVKAVNLKLYQRNGRIVVSGADGADVRLYDAVGRLLATKQDNYSELEFDVPASGAYLIRVGNLYARRIVVVR